MKFSWGVGIALTYILFVIVVIILVLFSSSKDVNLVTDDYYAKELIYQEQIEKIERTKNLDEQLLINISGDSINFHFPKIFNASEIKGNILFYRPSNRNMDTYYKIELNSDYIFSVNVKEFLNGLWKIKVDWNMNNTEYYNEKIIMLD